MHACNIRTHTSCVICTHAVCVYILHVSACVGLCVLHIMRNMHTCMNHTHVCVCVRMCTSMYIGMCMCVCVCVKCICIYMHAHTFTSHMCLFQAEQFGGLPSRPLQALQGVVSEICELMCAASLQRVRGFPCCRGVTLFLWSCPCCWTPSRPLPPPPPPSPSPSLPHAREEALSCLPLSPQAREGLYLGARRMWEVPNLLRQQWRGRGGGGVVGKKEGGVVGGGKQSGS